MFILTKIRYCNKMTLDSQQMTKALKYLDNLSEADLRKDVIVPLFKKLGFNQVVEYHGREEFGKDIVFKQLDKISGPINAAALVKRKKYMVLLLKKEMSMKF